MAKRPKTALKPVRQRERVEPVARPARLRYTKTGPEISVSALGYRSAEMYRKSGRPLPVGGSPDFHLQIDRGLIRDIANSFARDNAIFKGMIDRDVANVLGNGFVLKSMAESEDLRHQVEELWNQWCLNPEVRGLDTFDELEDHMVKALDTDGEAVLLLLDAAQQVQMIDSQQLCYPGGNPLTSNPETKNRVIDGVEVDNLGCPLAFWIAPYNASGQVQTAKAKRWSAEKVIYLVNRDKLSQTRGTPPWQTAFPMLHRLDDVLDSEAYAWQILSRYAVAVMRKDASALAEATSINDPDSDGSTRVTDRVQDLGQALIFNGEPGEEIRGVDRNIPGANFPESVRMYLRLIGLPASMPLELMLLDWSDANFSQSKAMRGEHGRAVGKKQKYLVNRGHRRIFNWLIGLNQKARELPRGPDALRHQWIVPSPPTIDEQKETEGLGLQVDRGLKTHSDVLKLKDRSRGDFLAERAAEVKSAIELAKTILDPSGQPVPWQIFAGLEPPAPSKLNSAGQTDQQNAGPE